MPPCSAWQFRFFAHVMRRAMRRDFHAVRLLRPGMASLLPGRPVIVYLNHPSWWDAAFVIVLAARYFAGRAIFAPIDAEQLRRYPFMGHIGAFGIRRDAYAGAAAFLRRARDILHDPRAVLWLMPEGALTDPRPRPLHLRPGLAHLLRLAPDAVLLPLALEYPFWQERGAEALAAFGTPFPSADLADCTLAGAQARLAARLEELMDRLAAAAVARDPAQFETLIPGRQGVGGFYGLVQRLRGLLRLAEPRPQRR
jgi:1-acyl-sn-glycerol-3-phosphate acyltransferase